MNCTREITSIAASLITAVKRYDQTMDNLEECVENARKLHTAVENLEKFIDNPDFGTLPARISASGRKAQQPLIRSAIKMLDASLDMIMYVNIFL